VALVLSDSAGIGLRALTSRRSRAALPFAGKYRLIDLALSGCVNSGIERVGVVTQYQARSLHATWHTGVPGTWTTRAGN
jgi:glucose-1-phosphate adenylyltransferase